MTDYFPFSFDRLSVKAATALSGLALLIGSVAPVQANTPATAETPTDVRYLPLEQLRSFYKLMPRQSSEPGVRSVGNAGTTLVLGPGRRDLNIGGYRWQLTYPFKDDGKGDLLISEVDLVKLIDPVLRPTYIAERRLVRTVVIDPGHGGYDTGIDTAFVHEADFNMQLAHTLREQLDKRGFTVVLTHEQNRHLSDQQRIECANGTDAAIFISLHLNSGRGDIQGVETYTALPDCPGTPRRPVNQYDAASAALAFAVHSSLVQATGAKDGACRRARYTMLNSIECPAIMVLAGYATHKEEGSQLASPEYRMQLATAITEGISSFARAINPDATLEPTPELPPEPEATPEPVAAPKPDPKPTKADTKPKNKTGKNKGNTKKTRKNNRDSRRR